MPLNHEKHKSAYFPGLLRVNLRRANLPEQVGFPVFTDVRVHGTTDPWRDFSAELSGSSVR